MSQFEDVNTVAVEAPIPHTMPTTWEYNGNKFELDIGDADEADHLEQALARFEVAEKALQKDGGLGDVIRRYDKMFRDLYDDVFGEGAGYAILGDKKNINNCNDAYDSFLSFIDSQKTYHEAHAERTNARYSGNRAQRRNAVYRRG